MPMVMLWGSDGNGRGAEFVVRLPRMHAVIERARASEMPSIPVASPESMARGRVLVVDDNQDAAVTLADMLGTFGYIARPVHDGPSALRVAEDFEPDIALLDIGLPVMDGYELARRFVAHPRLCHTQLVAITGYGQEQDRERSAAAGFVAHLVKPVEIDHLRSVLSAMSDTSREH
jgi:CheY-like chemotaxis protein